VLSLLALMFLASDSLALGAEKQHAQATILLHVATTNDQSYTIKVQGLKQNNSDFLVDLGSFAKALRLRPTVTGDQIKIDDTINRAPSSCVIRVGNSFALIFSQERESEKRVLQLKANPELLQSKVYLPVDQACRLLTIWLDREIVYSPEESKVKASFGAQRPAQSYHAIGIVKPDGEFEPREGGASTTGATVIQDLKVDTRANGVVIKFDATGRKTASSFIRPDERGIAYLTFEKASGNLDRLTKTYADGVIKSIQPLQLPNGGLQFTIALNTDAFVLKSADFQRDEKNNDYMIYLLSNVDVQAIRRMEKEKQIQQQLSGDLSKWKLDAIVLDAGHGGKDSGALGTRGTMEKDVVLNIIRDIGMFVTQKWPDVKVIYTRKDDRFIPLNERGKIANRYGGKLFVSVHCNATTHNNIHGAEVYILGPNKNQKALEVAMFENSVITREENYKEQYKGFSDEYLIMSSMAQSAFARQSTDLAQHVLKRIERSASNNGLGVRQAGFMVLWTPSMPSILVETGYLSNPDEEKILRNREEQTKIAYGIFQGLQQFKSNYENSVTASGKQQ
jgi:N-acetylmuramoyl-L-alanine amidase